MNRWAIVPFRGLRSGKRRLAGTLAPVAREALNRELLEATLRAVAAALGGWRRCIVQSADPLVVAEVRRRGGVGQLDLPGAGLNDALDHARRTARRCGAEQLLVLSADLPAATADAVRALLAAAAGQAVAIVADKTGSGTNGLLLPAGLDLRFEFGAASLQRHWRQCERLRCPALVWRSRELQFDLDTEDDWRYWQRQMRYAMAMNTTRRLSFRPAGSLR